MIKIGGSKTNSSSTQAKQETLDPVAKGGLDLLINQATELKDSPLNPGLSSQTLSGIDNIGNSLGGIDPLALETLQNTASGNNFVPGDRGALERATGVAAENAADQVGDTFTAGGRTGSPANAKAIAEGVANAVSPFAFSFEQNELARRDASTARQTAAAFGLQEIKSADDAAVFQAQIAQLEAAGLLDAEARAKLEEPFRRLGLLSGAITGAAGIAPKGVTGTGSSSGSTIEAGFTII